MVRSRILSAHDGKVKRTMVSWIADGPFGLVKPSNGTKFDMWVHTGIKNNILAILRKKYASSAKTIFEFEN